jgi:hypothetical protein
MAVFHSCDISEAMNEAQHFKRLTVLQSHGLPQSNWF